MKVVLLLVAFVVGRSAYGYFDLGLVMRPDFQLYTQGGIGLFPSPVGRLLGVLGPVPFALVSIAASGVCVWAVALAARRRGLSPRLAAVVFVCSPGSLYLAYAGIDSIGLALLLLSIAGAWSAWTLPLSALTHLSLAPFSLLALPRTLAARAAVGVVAACTFGSLLLTPYAGILTGLLHSGAPAAMGYGFLVSIVLSFPALLFVRGVPGMWWVATGVGVAECGLQHHLQARYLLPAAAVAAVYARSPRWVERLQARESGAGAERPKAGSVILAGAGGSRLEAPLMQRVRGCGGRVPRVADFDFRAGEARARGKPPGGSAVRPRDIGTTQRSARAAFALVWRILPSPQLETSDALSTIHAMKKMKPPLQAAPKSSTAIATRRAYLGS